MTVPLSIFTCIECGKDYDINETCLGYTYNGSVGFEIRGGTGPYIYDWFNSDTSRTGIDTTSAIYFASKFISL